MIRVNYRNRAKRCQGYEIYSVPNLKSLSDLSVLCDSVVGVTNFHHHRDTEDHRDCTEKKPNPPRNQT